MRKTVELTVPLRQILLVAAACLAFVVAGVWMMASGEFLTGLLAVLFFGICGLWALLRMWRQRVIIRLTPAGLEPAFGPTVAWDNIGKVGVGHYREDRHAPMVGVQLLDYQRYIVSLSPAEIRVYKNAAKASRYAGLVLTPLTVGIDSALEAAVSRDLKKLLPTWDLLSMPQLDVARQLAWTRQISGGWDLLWAGSVFEQGAVGAVSTIDEYRRGLGR